MHVEDGGATITDESVGDSKELGTFEQTRRKYSEKNPITCSLQTQHLVQFRPSCLGAGPLTCDISGKIMCVVGGAACISLRTGLDHCVIQHNASSYTNPVKNRSAKRRDMACINQRLAGLQSYVTGADIPGIEEKGENQRYLKAGAGYNRECMVECIFSALRRMFENRPLFLK